MTEEKSHSDLLPLVAEKHEYEDTRTSSFKLLTDPTEPASVTYYFKMHQIDGSEPLREILTFRTNVNKLG